MPTTIPVKYTCSCGEPAAYFWRLNKRDGDRRHWATCSTHANEPLKDWERFANPLSIEVWRVNRDSAK